MVDLRGKFEEDCSKPSPWSIYLSAKGKRWSAPREAPGLEQVTKREEVGPTCRWPSWWTASPRPHPKSWLAPWVRLTAVSSSGKNPSAKACAANQKLAYGTRMKVTVAKYYTPAGGASNA